MNKVNEIMAIDNHKADDIFITCASFEERCLGSIKKLFNYKSKKVIIFKFSEENPTREANVNNMLQLLEKLGYKDKYSIIDVSHGVTIDGIVKFHGLYKKEAINNVTIDITTFTKELLFELMFYINDVIDCPKVRYLYTTPEKYASPEEGALSYGIKSIKVMPFYWNKWSSIHDDILFTVLGYEEMRAWSLISRFDANINCLVLTNPGSKKDWDEHCEKFNAKLLKEKYDKYEIPAIDPIKTIHFFEKLIIHNKLHEKNNIFISPMGTKPQALGIYYFLKKHPEANINILSTTAVEHNTPYYSWGIGDTYYIDSIDMLGSQ
jgi:hypothetical protein